MFDNIYNGVDVKRTISSREFRTQDLVTRLCFYVFLGMIIAENNTTTWCKHGTGNADTSFVSTFHCLWR